MNVLVIGSNMYGIVNLLVGVAQSLSRRGHSVQFLVGKPFQDYVARYGVRYGELWCPEPQHPVHTLTVCLGGLQSACALLDQIPVEGPDALPDVIVTSHDGIPGVCLAKALDIPLVVVSPFEPNEQFLDAFWTRNSVDRFGDVFNDEVLRRLQRDFAEASSHLLERHGVEVPDSLEAAALCGAAPWQHTRRLDLICNTERFLGPYWDVATRHECVGSLIRRETERSRIHSAGPRRRDRPLVLVSLGTVYSANQAFFDQCAEGLGPMDMDVVYSRAFAPLDTGHAPDNFHVAEFVTQTDVLKEADVFVTHGGINSVHEALEARVPCVVCPQGYDQFIIAERLGALGAALVMGPDGLSAQAFRAAVCAAHGDAQLRSSVHRLGDEYRLAGGTERAVTALEEFMAADGSRCTTT